MAKAISKSKPKKAANKASKKTAAKKAAKPASKKIVAQEEAAVEETVAETAVEETVAEAAVEEEATVEKVAEKIPEVAVEEEKTEDEKEVEEVEEVEEDEEEVEEEEEGEEEAQYEEEGGDHVKLQYDAHLAELHANAHSDRIVGELRDGVIAGNGELRGRLVKIDSDIVRLDNHLHTKLDSSVERVLQRVDFAVKYSSDITKSHIDVVNHTCKHHAELARIDIKSLSGDIGRLDRMIESRIDRIASRIDRLDSMIESRIDRSEKAILSVAKHKVKMLFLDIKIIMLGFVVFLLLASGWVISALL